MSTVNRDLARRIEAVIRLERGCAELELAEHFELGVTELRGILWPLYRQGRVDICAGWWVATPDQRAVKAA